MVDTSTEFEPAVPEEESKAIGRMVLLVSRLLKRYYWKVRLLNKPISDEHIERLAIKISDALRAQISGYKGEGQLETWVKANSVLTAVELSELIRGQSATPTSSQIYTLIERVQPSALPERLAYQEYLNAQEVDIERASSAFLRILASMPPQRGRAVIRLWVEGCVPVVVSEELDMPVTEVYTLRSDVQDSVLSDGPEQVCVPKEAPHRLTGRIKWFDHQKRYGFIRRDDGEPDVFVHMNDFRDRMDAKWLRRGDRVEFGVEDAERGARAQQVIVVDSSLRSAG